MICFLLEITHLSGVGIEADVRSALTEIGVLSADVGRVTDGVGVRIISKEESIHYCQIRCEEDELARMWTLYPRNE